MTNYNDGNWHIWNGGECPVHPKSVVEARIRLPSASNWDAQERSACEWAWHHDINKDTDIIAFRVVKEYREPRDFWIADIKGWKFSSAREAKTAFPGCTPIHVREVTE